MGITKKALYRVVTTGVESVPVGSLLVDRDFGRAYTWNLWDSTTGEFRSGWCGIRVRKLCATCFALPKPKATARDHPETHEDAPSVVPAKEAR